MFNTRRRPKSSLLLEFVENFRQLLFGKSEFGAANIQQFCGAGGAFGQSIDVAVIAS